MRRPLCGFLNIDKPAGMTSRDVVNTVQRLVKPLKVGHAGTLDPLATGVLVVAVGHATRLVSIVQESPKKYTGTFRLGIETTTEDITGEVIRESAWDFVTESQLRAQLPALCGEIQQVPSRFSAVHVNGERAYNLARRGVEFELAAKTIRIDALQLVNFAPPFFTLTVACGGGTYVRALGRDLGIALGCGATMTALRRDAIGPFLAEKAISHDTLNVATIERELLPSLYGITNLSQVTVTADDAKRLLQGKKIVLADVVESSGRLEPDIRVAIVGPDHELVGLGHVSADGSGLIEPDVMFPIAAT